MFSNMSKTTLVFLYYAPDVVLVLNFKLMISLGGTTHCTSAEELGKLLAVYLFTLLLSSLISQASRLTSYLIP